jgi:hypothetical protein
VLIDRYMPRWDARERHAARVRATPEAVYAALRTADLASSPAVRVLFALRALPAAVLRGRAGLREHRARAAAIRLEDFERQGFSVLEEDPPRELLIGLEGRFWRPSGELRAVDAASFAGQPPEGTARAAWNFAVEPHGDGSCTLSTETRILCADAAARRSFRLYWAVVRPGSGLIRRMMLAAIRREAESEDGGGR